uniref:Uncharacterized protein n=1 Tax=Glossina pallidipes TaxID=7398 RepID=A0A1B0A5Q4_GLOPL
MAVSPREEGLKRFFGCSCKQIHGVLKCHEAVIYTTHSGYTFLDNLVPLIESHFFDPLDEGERLPVAGEVEPPSADDLDDRSRISRCREGLAGPADRDGKVHGLLGVVSYWRCSGKPSPCSGATCEAVSALSLGWGSSAAHERKANTRNLCLQALGSSFINSLHFNFITLPPCLHATLNGAVRFLKWKNTNLSTASSFCVVSPLFTKCPKLPHIKTSWENVLAGAVWFWMEVVIKVPCAQTTCCFSKKLTKSITWLPTKFKAPPPIAASHIQSYLSGKIVPN